MLLYHSTFSTVPANLEEGLHNVTPDELRKQLIWLNERFDILPVDEFIHRGKPTGSACITIDDGYQSFFKEGFPVFKELEIPCTVYLCGFSFEGKVFWRDKIRYMINNGLVDPFLEFRQKHQPEASPIQAHRFFQETKTSKINSATLDKLLDDFSRDQGIDMADLRYCIARKEDLISDPLISYGNHTYDHYVLSSLSAEEQEIQIRKNHDFLASLGVRMSENFSIPFGGNADFNPITCQIVKECGYRGMLFSRWRINTKLRKNKNLRDSGITDFQLATGDRYMPESTYRDFQIQLAKITIKELFDLY